LRVCCQLPLVISDASSPTVFGPWAEEVDNAGKMVLWTAVILVFGFVHRRDSGKSLKLSSVSAPRLPSAKS
jgi:hypothetical protein